MKPVPAPAEGLGVVNSSNYMENQIVRQYSFAIGKVLSLSEFKPWIDCIEEFCAKPDFHFDSFKIAEILVFSEMIKSVTTQNPLPGVLAAYSNPEHPAWKEHYIDAKNGAVVSALSQRIASLENGGGGNGGGGGGGHDRGGRGAKRDRTARDRQAGGPPPDPSPSPRISEKRAKGFELMNSDLLPFDGGSGCTAFHNKNACPNVNCPASHVCPLKSCNGAVHSFKFKHANLNWRGRPLGDAGGKAGGKSGGKSAGKGQRPAKALQGPGPGVKTLQAAGWLGNVKKE